MAKKKDDREVQAAVGAVRGSARAGYKLSKEDRQTVKDAATRPDSVGESAKGAIERWEKVHGNDF